MCGPAINDAPSYRAAEAALGREVQREVLIPRCRTARPGAAPSDMGSVNLERMGPVFDREDTTLDHDLTGRDLRGRLGWPSDRPPLQHRTEQAGLFAKQRSRSASMTF